MYMTTEKHNDTYYVIAMATLFRPHSLSVKNQISPFAISQSGTGGLAWHTHGSHIV